MKAALWVLVSMTSPLPVLAQGRIDGSADGPIGRSIKVASVRLAVVPVVIDAVSPDTDWSRVRKLDQGTEVAVTVKGRATETHCIVSTDEASMTVLNVTDPALRPAEAHLLNELACKHPESLAAVRAGATVPLGQNMRLTQDGVFAGDQKRVALAQIVQAIPRIDVAEVKRKVTRGSAPGAIGGAAGGFLIGWALAVHLGLSVQCQPNCGAVEAGIALSLVGLPIAGGILGYHAFARTTEEVIYRTP